MPEADPDLSGDPSDYEPEIHNTDGTEFRVTEGIELPSTRLELSYYRKIFKKKLQK